MTFLRPHASLPFFHSSGGPRSSGIISWTNLSLQFAFKDGLIAIPALFLFILTPASFSSCYLLSFQPCTWLLYGPSRETVAEVDIPLWGPWVAFLRTNIDSWGWVSSERWYLWPWALCAFPTVANWNLESRGFSNARKPKQLSEDLRHLSARFLLDPLDI